MTGESAPVIRESGGDRSRGHRRHRGALGPDRRADHLRARPVVRRPDDRAGRGVGAAADAQRGRAQHPAARADGRVRAGRARRCSRSRTTAAPSQSILVLVALLVCLIPTTIGALLSAIGIAGMDRLVRRNVLAMSGRAVEAAGDVDVLLLDKTGTITYGNRQATELIPLAGSPPTELAEAALLSSLADETPEGRSIVDLVARAGWPSDAHRCPSGAELVAFSAHDPDERASTCPAASIRKGAGSRRGDWVHGTGGRAARRARRDRRADHRLRRHAARRGGAGRRRPARVLGVIHLKDVVKEGMRERFDELRAMGIRTVMITGDNAAHRPGDRRGGRRRRLPRRGHARGQDGADPQGAGGRPAGRDVRRRHQRRPRAGPGRRRGRDEHRHDGGQGGRQHGRPRLRPDEAASTSWRSASSCSSPAARSRRSRSPTTSRSTSPSCRRCSSSPSRSSTCST